MDYAGLKSYQLRCWFNRGEIAPKASAPSMCAYAAERAAMERAEEAMTTCDDSVVHRTASA